MHAGQEHDLCAPMAPGRNLLRGQGAWGCGQWLLCSFLCRRTALLLSHAKVLKPLEMTVYCDLPAVPSKQSVTSMSPKVPTKKKMKYGYHNQIWGHHFLRSAPGSVAGGAKQGGVLPPGRP